MKRATLWIAILAALAPASHAAEMPLDDLSLEDLVKTEITSVSRKSQSMADIPAAAFVITAEDIRRSGAQALPDVLRMAPGIQVSQIDNGRYAVTARGFNGRFANKLQVLVDGRSIYHPMFSGVMWELDPIPLDDIERIEVIRGAGAVMWGANAVNGVINIISKHSRSQQGGAANITAGTGGSANVYARIGQSVNETTGWKLSAQGRYGDVSTQFANSEKANDRLENFALNFRLDSDLGAARDFTLWASATHSTLGDLWRVLPDMALLGAGVVRLDPLRMMQRLHSESLVGRYRWLSNGGIESSLQLSASLSGIEINNFIDETRTTIDMDYLGRYAIGAHDLQWGIGLRNSSDEVSTTGAYISIRNNSYTHRTSGVFVQDDWTLVPEKLRLGLGLRWDTASRNGNSYSPHATLLWTPSRTDSAWLKYAHAPRTAARAEQDISVLAGLSVQQTGFGNLPIVQYAVPNPNGLNAEKAQGVEIGYRKQISNTVSADLTAYRYRYTNLRSGTAAARYGCNIALAGFGLPVDIARCPGILSGQFVLVQELNASNNMSGWSDGVEVAGEWLVTPHWRLQLSYTWSRLNMDEGIDAVGRADATNTERANPRHTASLRSQWNVTPNQQLDVWLRAMSEIDRVNVTNTTPSTSTSPSYIRVPGYVTLDLRYGYHITKDLEVAVIGRNLASTRRFEYVSDYIPTIANEIKPSFMLTTRWKF
ncbi:MAG: TonB-dependent receptor [Proteobacteria bacterium]|nr:TonB-dependent receptor [Pseudomonadota bacterium]